MYNIQTEYISKKLDNKWKESFTVVKKINDVVFKLELLVFIKIHSIFYVSLLIPDSNDVLLD